MGKNEEVYLDKIKFSESEVASVLEDYVKVLHPYILSLQTLDGNIPPDLLNEIRELFTLIGQCSIASDEESYSARLEKIDSYFKKALILCLKSLISSYDKKYIEFEKKYHDVDLSIIDNGFFLKTLDLKRDYALNIKTTAYNVEADSSDINDIYQYYEKAYNAFVDVNYLIASFLKSADYLKRRAYKKELRSIISLVVGVAGLYIGIAGFIFGLFFGLAGMMQ